MGKGEGTESARIIAVLCLFFFLCCSEGEAGDWPQFLGPDRNSVSNEKGWTHDWAGGMPPVSWKTRVGTGFANVAVKGDRLFTMGNREGKEWTYSLDNRTGRVLWKRSHPAELLDRNHEGGPCATPTVDRGLVFAFGKTGHLFCYDAETGKVVWHRDLVTDFDPIIPMYGFCGSPWVEGEYVIVDIGSLVALDRKTGALVWRSPPRKAGYASPVGFTRNGKRCLATLNAYGLVVIDASTGQELGKHRWKTFDDCNITTPVLTGNGRIFISSGYGRGCALLDLTGLPTLRTLWENKEMSNHFSNSVFHRGNLYGFDGHISKGKSMLKCLDLSTGKTLWAEPSVNRGSLIIADGKIIALTSRGELVVAEAAPDGFQELTRAQVLSGKCWTAPVLSGGRIYCRNARGDLVCLDVSEP